MLSRRDRQPESCGPESSHHYQQEIHGEDIDPWTRIQSFFKMPSQTGLKELNINHGWPVMVLLPLAGLAKIFHWNPTIVLVVNIVAIIFLSESISISSDELAAHLGELQGALLSATFGNTVELTVSQNYCPKYLTKMLTQPRREFSLWFTARSHLHNLSWLAVSSQIFCS
jgi:Ca2+:H+ antiporter